MPFTLGAFDASVNSTTLAQVAAITDLSLNVQSSNIVVDGRLPLVVGAYALGGTGITRAQLQAPSLRNVFYPELSPVEAAALPTAPTKFVDLRFTPFQLLANEQVGAYITNGGAAQTIVGVWLADQPIAPVAGPVRSIRFTSATTLVANAWTQCAITLADSLPSGRYQLVGGRVWGTSPILFRFAVSGYPWRPGGIAMPNATLADAPQFRWGNFGVWLEFTNVLLPVLEVLATAADTAQTGVLDVIYLGP